MPDESHGARPSTQSEKLKKVNGGARQGAGRKAGGQNAKTKARLERAERAVSAAAITPLEVMLGAMAEDWQAAHDETLESAERAKHRDAAVTNAVRAAPYVHPTLKAVDASGSSLNRHHVTVDATAAVLGLLTPEQLAEARRQALEQQENANNAG